MNGICEKGECPAKAYVTVVYLVGELEFCEHHAREVVSPSFMHTEENTAVVVRTPVVIRTPVPA